MLVDTAGLRRPGKRTTTDVEYYSSLRALKALERSDVALVVVDAAEGLVDLDLQVAYEAQRAKCATAILFNKWDVAGLDLDKAVERIRARVQMKPPHLTVSALTGRGVDRVLPLASGPLPEVRGTHPHRRAQPVVGIAAGAPPGDRQRGQVDQDLLHGPIRTGVRPVSR